MAARIRARAIKRCGELLREIPAKPGKIAGASLPQRSDRAAAAKAAGLSTDQTKDALRVARIPAAEFEAAYRPNSSWWAQYHSRASSKTSPSVGHVGPTQVTSSVAPEAGSKLCRW